MKFLVFSAFLLLISLFVLPAHSKTILVKRNFSSYAIACYNLGKANSALADTNRDPRDSLLPWARAVHKLQKVTEIYINGNEKVSLESFCFNSYFSQVGISCFLSGQESYKIYQKVGNVFELSNATDIYLAVAGYREMDRLKYECVSSALPMNSIYRLEHMP